MTTVRTIIVLEVSQDYEPGPETKPEWWEALGLPAPEYWNEKFPTAHVKVHVDRKVAHP